MTANKPSKAFRFLPSIAEFIFIIIFAAVLAGAGNLLGDADTGYHIRAGEYITDNLKVPHHDIFSHVSPALEWTAHEWLSEVIFDLVHNAAGLTGIVVFTALIIAAVYAVLMRHLQACGITIIVAAMTATFVISASTIHWLARPHIFSLLLMLIWYIILDSYQYRQKNYLYLLPPVMALWVNLHGGFIAGLMLTGVYIAGNALTAVFKRSERQGSIRKTGMLLLFFAVCTAAAVLNPKGYKILLFPFSLVSNEFIMNHVNEFLSPNFHDVLIYEYMLLFMILVFGISARRLNAIEITLVLLFTHMSLYSARYIPLYAIILSPILAKQVDFLLQESKDRWIIRRLLAVSERTAKTDSTAKYNLWAATAVIVIMILLFTGRLSYEFDAKKLPVDAVRFMQKEKIPGNMFNNDEFGDYIIYAAWPEYRVFFDGRSDMYGADMMKEYFKITGVEPGWEDVLKKYGIDWIIYNNKSVLSRFLLERSDYKLIYSDKVANIFVRNIPEYRHLIGKYPDVKPVIVEEEDKK